MAGPIRSSSRSRGRRAMADINVVPYIDVMLVLLVIFMVTAPMVAPSIVNLPTVANASPQQQTPPVIVNIDANNQLLVRYKDAQETHEQKMTEQDMLTFLQNRQEVNPDQPVVIAADKTVRYEMVMNVMSDLKAQGIKRVGLLVKQK
ncbi:protein TolR [Pandoraea sp.]|uniref:protein TolR n=1 Tax=Pandoraea sp. TaxID=1883445 RepID=UPI0011FBF744|nr:protein TolR [Pandoraea sp.]MBU6491784.1 protein TolR [Burkholderiales bacterium]MDE2288167.1 protein TolR [Burkholderiales bacterium]MDE2611399.1 protein TolR [Burkholderiales bacterium]TAL56198.1 MAG: protein TolR [Pandoraea sp.]TAM19152.1 MAG: protein TolR [Pandoraea sp.]